jgi:guanine deaminase
MEDVGEYVVRGNLIYTETMDRFSALVDGCIMVKDGRIQAVGPYQSLANQDIPVLDYRGALIIPGFVDLHVHAPQYGQIGIGMDETLLQWLEQYTFPEEKQFADPAKAAGIYTDFIRELADNGTTVLLSLQRYIRKVRNYYAGS